MESPEPSTNASKYILRLDKVDYGVFTLYKTAQACQWTVEEVDLSKDLAQYNKLSSNEKHFIKHVLAFFASSDLIVNENLVRNFYDTTDLPEARLFYGFQIYIENVHSEMYSTLISTFVKDKTELNHLFDGIETIPVIKNKAAWALRWINNPDATHAERLIAFAAVEGIFFSSSFAAIYFIKEKGLMPGLTFSNELISRDEGLHVMFACVMFDRLKNRPTPSEITEIITSAVDLEISFARDALPVSLLGINADVMSTYIQFVADWLLINLGCAPHYNVTNPLKFMEKISIDGKTNFFERRVGDYQKANLANIENNVDMFCSDGDF